jgi:hypothetical protein
MYILQKIRGLLFYLSVLLFFTALPFILSYALGYKFNTQNFKFVKTGLIFIKTQPPGAQIYLNGRLFREKSPASIQELLPGSYKISLELARHYPWKGQVEVEAGKASRIDKIILFAREPNLAQLNQAGFSTFRVDHEKKVVYYLDQEKKLVYRSNLDASNFEDIASLPDGFNQINGWEVSPDKSKLFIYNHHQINIIYFDTQNDYAYPVVPVFIDYPQVKVLNVFWHSNSYHLVVLTDRNVQVVESRPQAAPVNLVELNKAGSEAFYDTRVDVLYFSDMQRDPEGNFHNNLYKLELSANPDLLERLITQPFVQGVPALKEEPGE